MRLAAVAMVLVFAAAAGHDIDAAPPTYMESATVVFSMPTSQIAPNAYYFHATSLITSGEAMTQIMLSPQAQHQIREAGGDASVDIALINLYSEQYPDYGEPIATLTSSSPSAANAHRTFGIAARLLDHFLAAGQAQLGVRPRNRISAQIIGNTGPTVQAGSRIRVLAGLTLLAVVAISTAWGFLDRRTARQDPARAGHL